MLTESDRLTIHFLRARIDEHERKAGGSDYSAAARAFLDRLEREGMAAARPDGGSVAGAGRWDRGDEPLRGILVPAETAEGRGAVKIKA